MVGTTGIEPVTPSMSRMCSTSELSARGHFEQRYRFIGPSNTDLAPVEIGLTPTMST